jgi:membrane-bound metal-dependent hydrolase YbcI (DUF457 family)
LKRLLPFTPFHFGPGAALHALAPRHVSFLAFCGGNILTDIEPLYFLLTHQYPVHRFFHTVVGATITWIITLALFLLAIRLGSLFSLPNWFGWRNLTPLPIAVGAALGAYSHLVLDGLTHADMAPFAPFTGSNPLLGAISPDALYLICIAAALAGVMLIAIRARKRRLK